MRLSRYLPLAVMTVLVLPVPFLRAQETSPDSMRIFRVDPILVTGTALAFPRKAVPNAVTVIGGRDIAETGQISVLPALSRQVPGLFVPERGVIGYGLGQGAGGISLRGMGGTPNTQVLVLTDGIPNIAGLFGHPIPDMLMTSGVDRIEVIRGPASLLYGSNALGGIVHIITRKAPVGGFGVDVSLSGGSYSTVRAEAGVRGGANGKGFTFRASRSQTEGHRPSSSFRYTGGRFGGEFEAAESVRLSVTGSACSFRAFDPGPEESPYADHWAEAFRADAGLSAVNVFGAVRGGGRIFLAYGDHDIYDGFRSRDYTTGLSVYQGVSPFAGVTLTGGADVRVSGGSASNVKTNKDFGTHDVTEGGGFLLVQAQVDKAAEVSAGVRYNHHRTAGGVWVPQAGLSISPLRGTTLRILAARGFRNPTIREIYLFPAPTPSLKPEDLWSYEAGVLQEIGPRAHVDVTAFVAEGSNMIRVSGMYPNMKLENSGKFVHRGFEAGAVWQPSAALEFNAAFSALDPGEQTMANPKRKLYCGLRWKVSRFALRTDITSVSGLFGADKGQQPLPDYVLVGIRAESEIIGKLSAYVAGDNILNRKYQLITGYPMPGTTFQAGLAWRAD
ncbi:MAG: TonB-dependent receptor [Bacteroidota bacterium]|nr:TonB-dependent receptor [Bacteroidota bacterium]